MVIVSYDPWLVAASVALSMMASFTGLFLTRGVSGLSEGQRHLRVSMAAIALGGGIWAMHFVATLAMRFPVPVVHDVIQTAASAAIAILLAGLALVLMHFGRRTRMRKVLAGLILGLGIVAMHYVGLNAMDGCRPVHDPVGFPVAGALAALMGVAAMALAYGRRSTGTLLAATVVFGASVVVVHFSAMHFTAFVPGLRPATHMPTIGNPHVALLVLLAGFLLSGAFLLTGASVLNRLSVALPAAASFGPGAASAAAVPARIPVERDGGTRLVPAARVAALKAEGHYTHVFAADGRFLCQWSITQAEAALAGRFLRTHRSWLVNPALVVGFDRQKDTGVCLFEPGHGLERAPVARGRLAEVRAALDL
ncbi:MAG: MHYT domain-containing protein [Alkalilacustris sp.]